LLDASLDFAAIVAAWLATRLLDADQSRWRDNRRNFQQQLLPRRGRETLPGLNRDHEGALAADHAGAVIKIEIWRIPRRPVLCWPNEDRQSVNDDAISQLVTAQSIPLAGLLNCQQPAIAPPPTTTGRARSPLAIDACVLEANDSRYHGKPPEELDWITTHRYKRAVAGYRPISTSAATKIEVRTTQQPGKHPPSRRQVRSG
jgi:hypothetical protein